MSRGLTLEGLAAFEASKRRRRAERCIGLAIRKGQAEGRIRKKGDVRSQEASVGLLAGKTGSPTDYLEGGRTTNETYAMADGVPADAFEAAIKEAPRDRIRHGGVTSNAGPAPAGRRRWRVTR